MNHEPDIQPRYLRIEPAARYTGLPPRLIRRLVHERRIPHSKAGRYVILSIAELDAWIAANRREAVR
jgi:excisionase family DNA binding protein